MSVYLLRGRLPDSIDHHIEHIIIKQLIIDPTQITDWSQTPFSVCFPSSTTNVPLCFLSNHKSLSWFFKIEYNRFFLIFVVFGCGCFFPFYPLQPFIDKWTNQWSQAIELQGWLNKDFWRLFLRRIFYYDDAKGMFSCGIGRFVMWSKNPTFQMMNIFCLLFCDT